MNGKTVAEVADSFDKNALVKSLQQKGYFIVSVQELKSGLTPGQKTDKSGKRKFTHNKVKLEDLLIFARQLSTMLDAGVTLLRSINVIMIQVESKLFAKILKNVRDDVEQGSSLSQALDKHPKTFNQFWVSLVEVGEASGTMPMVLAKLAFYLEQEAAFKSSIVSAIMYPSILFGVAVGAILFFAFWVAPRFELIFTTLGSELPLLTKILLNSFTFVKKNFILIVLGIGAIVFLVRKYISTYRGRVNYEKFLFSLPTVGKIVKLIVVERFSSMMAILVDSGVPILHALSITQKLVDNHICAAVVNDIKEGVREGKLLVGPMEESGFFPPLAIQMITVGEETGELSKMLKHVAGFYLDAVQTFMKRFGTIIEPIMLIFMGVVIGIIVLAMFLPLFDIATM